MNDTLPPQLSMASLRPGYQALVLGASGALGGAFVAALGQDARCGRVLALSRQTTPALHLESADSMARCAQWLATAGPLHLVVDATGALTLDGRHPEKRLDDLHPQALARQFEVNAIGPALALQHFLPLLATGERVVWAKLSARVGSIEDNRKGGWYGYRASKAALNMLLQTAAIEIGRRRPLAVVAALQPGTVRSALSSAFVGDQADPPELAAARLLRVLDGLPAQGRAHFVDHRGDTIPW